MDTGLAGQFHHFLDHGGNMLYLCIDVGRHIHRGSRAILQLCVVAGQLVHAKHNDISAVLILGSKFADNRHAV